MITLANAPNATIVKMLNPTKSIDALVEVNARVWLRDLNDRLGGKFNLLSLPTENWDLLLRPVNGSKSILSSLYFMGLWQTSPQAHQMALTHLGDYRHILSDAGVTDVAGSPYAIYAYQPYKRLLSSIDELIRLRALLNSYGVKLILDFASNHFGVGAKLQHDHPEYFVSGLPGQYVAFPNAYNVIPQTNGLLYLARGKERRHYSSWEDTLQINYANPKAYQDMIEILLRLAKYCDGVRADMAHTALTGNFLATWGDHESVACNSGWLAGREFWADAISQVKRVFPGFSFIAEAYTNEDQLATLGFDFVYAKTALYDLLYRIVKNGETPENLQQYLLCLSRWAREHQLRFTDNHDEESSLRIFGRDESLAITAIQLFVSGGKFMFYEGQMDGLHRQRIPIQLERGPTFVPDPELNKWYQDLLFIKASRLLKDGKWEMLERRYCGNNSSHNIITQGYRLSNYGGVTIAVNLSNSISACNLVLPNGAVRAYVYDVKSGIYLPENVIAKPYYYGDNALYFVELKPWHIQFVFWEEGVQ